MAGNQFHLLTTRRFLPLFATQALGALNDNVFKNALAVLIIFRIAENDGLYGQVLVSAAAGIFILPFLLFSATAGQLADKLEKSTLIRWIKFVEVLVMSLGAISFWIANAYLMIFVLFLMGVQSTFFGPVKYSILPDHLSEDELIGGNGFIKAGTFLAILMGTIAGGLIILGDHGTEIISALVVGLASLGLAASFGIPRAAPPEPSLKLNINFLDETWNIIRYAGKQRDIFSTIFGISWFWLVGATFLVQFPAYAKNVVGADQTVVTLFLALFSVGISLGSLLCNKILKSEVSAKFVPFGAVGITVFITDLYLASMGREASSQSLMGIGAFLEVPGNWRIAFDLIATSICGGLFIVPLYAILQTRSEESHRSRVIAANNVVNALFMVAGALAATVALAMGFSVPQVFLVLAVINGVVAVYVCRLLPDSMIKGILISVLKLCYRVEIHGLENYKDAGERAVVIVNHVSYLDALLLAVYLPVKPLFAINSHIAEAWWMKPFLNLADAFPMDQTNPMAIKSLIRAVRENRHCVIFPEGRITVTGALMKVYESPGMVAEKADAMLVPVRIDGAQYTPFSLLKGKIRLRWFPKITMTIMPPQKFEIPEEILGRDRRTIAGNKLYDVMSEMIFETADHRKTLFDAILDAKKIHGAKQPVAEDIDRAPLNYARLVLGALILGRKLARLTAKGEYVGMMLPNSVGAVVTFFALQAYGRVPAMLNFSSGAKSMRSAVTAARIRSILTSRRFVEMADMTETVLALSEKADIIYLEDIKGQINIFDKLWGLISRPFIRSIHARLGVSPDEPAVVLFTSGSEGAPKGVVLSHANLLANRNQLAARIDFNPTDIVFNALPIFHSFGLTGGTLLPMLSGIKTFLYPSPLHYRIVPPLVYDTNATILFGTDTFLTGYAKIAHPYDFYSLRYVFAGAEKVKDETRRIWSDKFGLRILEGYGATETAPVIAANTPMHFKAGTVGRCMPGIRYELEPVPGIDDGGKLIVTGPNVMLGYLRPEEPGVLERTQDQRYDTGDIVTVDMEGFITIKGRVKRFAKIAGEMVSLSAVESYTAEIWPENMHAVVSVADSRKGEQLVLVTDKADAKRQDLSSHAKTQGITELMVPKVIRIVDAVPVLGTGKVDYVGVNAMVKNWAL